MSDISIWQRKHNLLPSYQRFPRSDKRHSLNISDEAFQGLVNLAEAFDCKGSQRKKIDQLLEMIGLHTLSVILPEFFFEGVNSTDDCEDNGRQDAIEGREANFRLIYPDGTRLFEEAYRRGYLQMKSDIPISKSQE